MTTQQQATPCSVDQISLKKFYWRIYAVQRNCVRVCEGD